MHAQVPCERCSLHLEENISLRMRLVPAVNTADAKDLHTWQVPPENRLDGTGNWGSKPFRGQRALSLPHPVLELPQFCVDYFEAQEAFVLFFAASGSHALNEGLQALLHVTRGRPAAKIGLCSWYNAGIGFLMPFQPPHIKKMTKASKPAPGMVDLRNFVPLSTNYSKEYADAGRYYLVHGTPMPSHMLDRTTVHVAQMSTLLVQMTGIDEKDAPGVVDLLLGSQDQSIQQKIAMMPAWYKSVQNGRFSGSLCVFMIELITSDGLLVRPTTKVVTHTHSNALDRISSLHIFLG